MSMRTALQFAPMLLLVACSSGSGSGATSFPIEVTSESGALDITLAPSGTATVGTNTFEMTVTTPDGGVPDQSLSVGVVPWMPAMGHGTAPATVMSMGDGRFSLSGVYLFMPGTWELEISISGASGAPTDHANPTFEIQ